MSTILDLVITLKHCTTECLRLLQGIALLSACYYCEAFRQRIVVQAVKLTVMRMSTELDAFIDAQRQALANDRRIFETNPRNSDVNEDTLFFHQQVRYGCLLFV